jgi:hypothetical protein
LLNLEYLDRALSHGFAERVMLLFCPLDPQDVIEQEIFTV